MKKLTAGFLLLLFCLFAFSSTASARSKSGPLSVRGGFSMGGGAISIKNGNTTTTQERRLDGGLFLGAGYNITKMFILTLETSWIATGESLTTNLGETSRYLHDFHVYGGLDVQFSGFLVGAKFGLAYFLVDQKATVGGLTTKTTTSEAGFGFNISAGYEIRFSRRLSIVPRFYYLHDFVKNSRYDSFGGTLAAYYYF